MKNRAVIRLLAMMTILFYNTALVQAGQVITQNERTWAEQALKQERTLGTVSAPNSVAVLYFNNKSGQDKLNALQKGMAVMLISDLSKVEDIQVVERIRMQALLDEMNLGATGLVAEETVPKVGKLLGASYMVSGDILGGKTQEILIDSSVLEILFETLTRQPIASGSLDELFRLEKEILFNIIDQMRVTVSPAKKQELEKPLSASTAALLALFLGIDYSDKGRYAEAANMYQQALVADPELEMARSALQELKAMGLSSAEELVTVEETPAAPPVEVEGSSAGTYVLVGLAAAAIGGAAFALSGSSSGSSDDGRSSDVPAAPDTTAPVATPSPGTSETLSCTEGAITFTFSKAMSTAGSVVISPKDFADSWGWSGDSYVISWANTKTSCGSSVTISLSGFEDTAGNALASPTTFEYSVSFP